MWQRIKAVFLYFLILITIGVIVFWYFSDKSRKMQEEKRQQDLKEQVDEINKNHMSDGTQFK